jgi:hypothetical protein
MTGKQPNSNPATASKVQLVAWPTVLFFIGLLVIFGAERMVVSEQTQRVLGLAGGAVMFGMLATLLSRRSSARDTEEQTAYSWLLLSALCVFLGVGVYYLFAAKSPTLVDSLHSVFGKKYDSAKDFASVLWPALVVLGALPMAFIQRALGTMTDGDGYAEKVELQRVRYSAQSGLTIALVVIFCASVNYVASERNHKWDLARFRSTRPSEATKKVVANLSRPVKATLFFPTPNEVRELVLPYFEELGKEGGRFTVDVLDHSLEPTKARDLSATGNGLIILSVSDDQGKLTQRETVNVGISLESAQSQLGTLDGEVQKKLLALSRPGRIAYFTVGHGERGFDSGGFFDMQKDDLRPPVGFLRTLLQNQGYEVRTLGVGQGLSTKVPGDAGLVIIAGPTEHVLPEEVAALSTYLEGGGHVYLLLDPAGEMANKDLAPLLKLAGIKYNPQVLVNDEVYAVRTHKAADKANIVSVSFSSHVSVTTLSRAAGRAGVILPRTGWFERDGQTPAGVQLDFTLRTMPKTYADLNGNFTIDPSNERQQVYEVAAVASKTASEADNKPGGKSKKELRLAVLGSIDALADLALQNRANAVLALDTIKWLMQDEAIVGETVQETDQPIVHTKDQDKLWFYSTIIAAPLLVLAVGFLYIGRVRRRRAS